MYLEWAPGNILSQNAPSENDASRSVIVGEHEAKRMLLEQQVEGISNVDIDPDRVEVCHFLLVAHFYSFYATILFSCIHLIYVFITCFSLSISYTPPCGISCWLIFSKCQKISFLDSKLLIQDLVTPFLIPPFSWLAK